MAAAKTARLIASLELEDKFSKGIASANKSLTGDNVTVQLVPVPQPGVAASTVGNVVPAAIEIAEL